MNSRDRAAAEREIATIIERVRAQTSAKAEFIRVMGWCLLKARAAYSRADSELPARPGDLLREVQRFWRCAQKLETIYRDLGPQGRRLLQLSCGSYPGWPGMNDPDDDRSWQDRTEEHFEQFFAPFRRDIEVRQSAETPPSLSVLSAEKRKLRFDRDLIAFWAEAFEKILDQRPVVSAGSPFLDTVADFLEAVEEGRSANLYEKAMDAKTPGRRNSMGFFLDPPDQPSE